MGKLNIYYLLTIILVGVILLTLFITILMYFIREKNRNKRVKDAINSSRIYVIDLLDNRYDYFQLNKLSNDITRPSGDDMNSIIRNQKAQFYRQFSEKDQIDFEDWINNLLNRPESTPKIKDVTIKFSSTKKEALALFEVLHVSFEDKRIYLKSVVLMNSKNRMQNVITKKATSKENALLQIEKNQFKGYTLSFKFYYINEESRKIKVSDALLEGLFDVLKRYMKVGRIITNEKIYSIINVIDFRLENKSQVEMLRASIISDFKKYLGLNGFIKDIGIASSALLNRIYNTSAESIFDYARVLDEGVANNEAIDFIFDDDEKVKDLNASNIDLNTISIIQNSVFYEFKPVVKIGNKSTREFGYFANITLGEQNITMRELRNSCEHDGTLPKLFSIPNTKILQAFDNECYLIPTVGTYKPKLFLHVRLADYTYFTKVFKPYIESTNQDWELVLCFKEEELINLAQTTPSIGLTISKLSKTYSFLLVLENNNEFKLPDKILSIFDYFAFDLSNISLHQSEVDNFNILSKAGKTTRYKKPIIMSGVSSWSDLELLINDGITLLSGNIISNKNLSVISPVDKRLLDKISAISRK